MEKEQEDKLRKAAENAYGYNFDDPAELTDAKRDAFFEGIISEISKEHWLGSLTIDMATLIESIKAGRQKSIEDQQREVGERGEDYNKGREDAFNYCLEMIAKTQFPNNEPFKQWLEGLSRS